MSTTTRNTNSFKCEDTSSPEIKASSNISTEELNLDQLSSASSEKDDHQDSFSLWQEESARGGEDVDDDDDDEVFALSEALEKQAMDTKPTTILQDVGISPPLSPISPTTVTEAEDLCLLNDSKTIVKKRLSPHAHAQVRPPLSAASKSHLSRRQAYRKSKSVGSLQCLAKQELARSDKSTSRRSCKSDERDYKDMALRVRRTSIEDRSDRAVMMRKCKSLRGLGKIDGDTSKFEATPPEMVTRKKQKSARSSKLNLRMTSRKAKSLREGHGEDILEETVTAPEMKSKSKDALPSPSLARRRLRTKRDLHRHLQSASNVLDSNESDDEHKGELQAIEKSTSPPIAKNRRDQNRRSRSASNLPASAVYNHNEDVVESETRTPVNLRRKAISKSMDCDERKSHQTITGPPRRRASIEHKDSNKSNMPPTQPQRWIREGRSKGPMTQPSPEPISKVLPKKKGNLEGRLKVLTDIRDNSPSAERVPSPMDQSGRTSISSITMSSDLFSFASSQRSNFNLPGCTLGHCASVLEEDENLDEEGAPEPSSRWSNSLRCSIGSGRKKATAGDSIPVKPSKDAVSVCGSQGPALEHTEHEIPETPSSVHTGIISELTDPSLASVHWTLLYDNQEGDGNRRRRPRMRRSHSISSICSDTSKQQTPPVAETNHKSKDGAPRRPARRTSFA